MTPSPVACFNLGCRAFARATRELAATMRRFTCLRNTNCARHTTRARGSENTLAGLTCNHVLLQPRLDKFRPRPCVSLGVAHFSVCFLCWRECGMWPSIQSHDSQATRQGARGSHGERHFIRTWKAFWFATYEWELRRIARAAVCFFPVFLSVSSHQPPATSRQAEEGPFRRSSKRSLVHVSVCITWCPDSCDPDYDYLYEYEGAFFSAVGHVQCTWKNVRVM